MSYTFCELEEVSLVNIISLTEVRLQRNFEVILKALANLGEKVADTDKRILKLENKSEAAEGEFRRRMEQVELSNQTAAEHQFSLKESLQHSIRSQYADLEQKLSEVQSKCEQSVTLLGNDAARVKEELIVLQTEEKKLMDVINVKHEKSDAELEKVRRQIGSLVVKSEHIGKKMKIQEEKLEKVEIETANTANNAQKVTEELAAKIVMEIKQGGFNLEALINSAANLSSKTLLENSDPNQPSSRGNIGAHSGKHGHSHSHRRQDPQGLARSVSELRERVQVQESNILKSLNKFTETFTKEIADVKSLRAELSKQSKQKSELNSSYLLEKIQEIRPELNRLSSRIDTNEDRSNFIERRMEEARKSIGELTAFTKENSMTRYDQKLKLIQTEFFSQLRELTTKVDLKTNSTEFVRACQNFEERFRQVMEFLNTKCEKLEVKKALLFIESKLKEIILVISEDEENEKDALLTKKNIKCISCDKELDRYSGLVGSESRNWNTLPTKELQPQHLGKFGITKFGSLVKKLKKLEGGELPVLRGSKSD